MRTSLFDKVYLLAVYDPIIALDVLHHVPLNLVLCLLRIQRALGAQLYLSISQVKIGLQKGYSSVDNLSVIRGPRFAERAGLCYTQRLD
jgi:hypothetical protein